MALNQVNAPQPKGPGKSKLDTFAEWLGPITSIAGLGTSAINASTSLSEKAAAEAAKKTSDMQLKSLTEQLKNLGVTP